MHPSSCAWQEAKTSILNAPGPPKFPGAAIFALSHFRTENWSPLFLKMVPLERKFVAAAGALRYVQEQLVHWHLALDQALLVGVAHQRLERLQVSLGQSVFPRVGTEHALLLLPGLAIPNQR